MDKITAGWPSNKMSESDVMLRILMGENGRR